MLRALADSVSGAAAFVGGLGTGAGLTFALTYPTSCTFEGDLTSPCKTIFQTTPLDEDTATILVLFVGLLLAGLAAVLRDEVLKRAERQSSNPR